MNRICKALGAFALSLTLLFSLSVMGPCAAAADLEGGSDAPFAGYLVMLKEPDRPVSQDDGASVAALFTQASLFAAQDELGELTPLAEDIGIYKTGQLEDIQNLVWSGQVELVEPDYEAQLFELDINDPAAVNDDYFQSGYQFNLTDANIPYAWDAGLTGENVTVAVIDSGLNTKHVDAPVKVSRGRYFFYREETNGPYSFTINGVTKHYGFYSNAQIEDDLGHGTMVSGIIAANTNNRSADYSGGIAGVAPNVTIMPVRCFTNTAGHLGGYTSNLIGGIDYATKNGANIINMSWGIVYESASLKSTVDAAVSAGCILIAAAGNDGASTLQYPAAWPNVISVGATNKVGGLSNFSQRTDTVNICAPGGTRSGQQIYSLGYSSQRSIARGDGTSFSAPVVAGAAALLKEHDPAMTQGAFLALLSQTSSYGNIAPADQPYAGYGVLDMKALLEATGHTGAMLRYGEDGSVTVRAAHFPAAGENAGASALILIGAYNAAGHLLDSRTVSATPAAGRGAYSFTTTFQTPEATTLRAYFLNTTTLAPLSQPVTALIGT